MRGRNSLLALTISAIFMSSEAAAISSISVESQEVVKTIEFEQMPDADIFALDADSGIVERTHDVQLMTLEDRDLMLRCAAAEGLNQGEDGQWMILSVIMNRVASDQFPDNVHDVIYQPHQFSVVTDGRIDTVEPQESTEMAMTRIEEGEIAPEVIAFEEKGSHILDKWFRFAFTFRDHDFYTKK